MPLVRYGITIHDRRRPSGLHRYGVTVQDRLTGQRVRAWGWGGWGPRLALRLDTLATSFGRLEARDGLRYGIDPGTAAEAHAARLFASRAARRGWWRRLPASRS